MTRRPPREPLIAIIGATGTGKSQLAVELAKHFHGEVINGDAMQLYAGLPIITNKIAVEEQQGIPHHLLGCIGLEEPTWVVSTWRRRALKVVDEIRGRGRLPILVGGTHYYTQRLLFCGELVEEEAHASGTEGTGKEAEHVDPQFPLLQQPTEVLLSKLQKVDPAAAERWHPNDRRKIQRSLEIYLKTGRTASDMYAEQQQRRKSGVNAAPAAEDGEGADTTERSLLFPTLIFWVHAQHKTLRERLNARVDKMLDAGLLDEVRTLTAHAEAEATAGRSVDETRGIWVSIGYKEFKSYVHALRTGGSSEKQVQRMKDEALEKTKAATRQYANRQLRWIRIKLLGSLPSSNTPYLLDGSDITEFTGSVVGPAIELTSSFLAAQPMPDPSLLSPAAAEMLRRKSDYGQSAGSERWTKQHCEVCEVTCVVEQQWQQHVRSKAHRKAVSKRRQREDERMRGIAGYGGDQGPRESRPGPQEEEAMERG